MQVQIPSDEDQRMLDMGHRLHNMMQFLLSQQNLPPQRMYGNNRTVAESSQARIEEVLQLNGCSFGTIT